MGKTRTKSIDDSQSSAEIKVEKKTAKKQEDSLVARLKEELGIEEKNQLSVLGSQVSEKSQSVVSPSETEKKKTEEPESENRKQKTDTRKTESKKYRSKKYLEVIKDLDKSKSYPLREAIDMVKKLSYSKFSGTLEAHINTVQTGIRGLVSLPFASGKKIRILAFGKGSSEAGADLIGSDSTLADIEKSGCAGFDLIITTPEWMPKLAKVARILGPKGLMPNPKNGTIVSGEDGLKKALMSFQAGKTEYKTESKAPLIHLGLGKLNQPTQELEANVKQLLMTLGKSKIKKITLSPTMGPAVKLDLNSI